MGLNVRSLTTISTEPAAQQNVALTIHIVRLVCTSLRRQGDWLLSLEWYRMVVEMR